jgi:hypothetical protein
MFVCLFTTHIGYMSIMRTLASCGGGTIISGGGGATGGVVALTSIVVTGQVLMICYQ